MKNIISILIFVVAFGCNENSKEKTPQANGDMVDSIAVIDREIHKYSDVKEVKYKDKEATYFTIATYLGASLNDYYYFPFKGEDGKYYDFAYGKNHLGSIPFGAHDAEMKSELIGKKFIIHWRWQTSSYPCCEGQMNNYEGDIASILSIEYYTKDSLHRKTSLIKNVDIKKTSYQLYENLVFFGHDTTNAEWSTESLSLFKNGTFNKELYKAELFIDLQHLKDSRYGLVAPATNAVSFASTLVSAEDKIILMFDISFDPSAPGEHIISFIQFEGHQVKHSSFQSISGAFTIKNGAIYGLAWQGFYGYELPYKLSANLDLALDTSKIHAVNNNYFLNINDSIRFPASSSELAMAIDPFGDTPLATTSVSLSPNTKVTLIYKDLASDWIKIKVSDQEGWIKDYEKMLKIGCQASG